MELKNDNEFLILKNYSNFLIDLGLDFFFCNEKKQNTTCKTLKSIKDIDNYIKNWQNRNDCNLILRNDNICSKNLILLSEDNNFLNLHKSKQYRPVLLTKMFASIGQNVDDFFIINIDFTKMKENHLKEVNDILKLYISILKPPIFIDMCSENSKKISEVYKTNLDGDYFKIPSISEIMKNQNLKRDAWVQLKLIKAKLNEFL